jgi:tetratricopeptide (TPR) repeat protein
MGAFSPSGREVLTVCNVAADKETEGRLRWWDVATGEPLTPFLVHSGEVHHAAISPRGSLTITACENGAAWLWPTSGPETRLSSDLQKLVEVLSGQRLDPRLGPVPLGQEALEARWRDLRSQYRNQFQKSSERIAAWHRFESEDCEAAKQWSATSWHLDRLIADCPTDWRTIVRRGNVDYAEGFREKAAERFAKAVKLGPPQEVYPAIKDQTDQYVAAKQWQAARWYLDWLLARLPEDAPLYVQRAGVCSQQGDRAQRLADLVKAVELGAGESVPAQLATERAMEGKWAEASRLLSLARERGRPFSFAHALACLKAGDLEGYRSVCEVSLVEAALHGGPNEANEAAWLCALKPGALTDPGRAVKLAEVALAGGSHETRAIYLNTLGAVLFRAKRHREAISKLNESIKLTSGGGFDDWVFLGFAHHALDEREEARRWFEKAKAAQKPGQTHEIH